MPEFCGCEQLARQSSAITGMIVFIAKSLSGSISAEIAGLGFSEAEYTPSVCGGGLTA